MTDPRQLLAKVPGFSAAKAYVRDRLLPGLARRRRFTAAYNTNYWRGEESRSGQGSSLVMTEALRDALPAIFQDLGIRSMLDVPCGDLNWMQHVEMAGLKYTGADIVPDLISANINRFGNSERTFIVLDLVRTVPPAADLVFCRDLLVHLPLKEIMHVLSNIRHSGAKWLLTTTFCNHQNNDELGKQDWRPLNLESQPFNFPRPQRCIVENCTQDDGRYTDKCMGLWRVEDLR